jgi:hypothetical protein
VIAFAIVSRPVTASVRSVPSSGQIADYMDAHLLPKDYKPKLSRKDAAIAADAVKVFCEGRMRSDFNMFKHSSPLAFVHGSGAIPRRSDR